ncbi:hypothetical protein DH2020_023203 [Rehmannia glutinosa]|uniref:SRP54-type proteins GTP-binding domain-containing protein n=1 Tax=Rehmannia glutinosa TaxID=99300 RepID=A0ABR0W9H5_REHGL
MSSPLPSRLLPLPSKPPPPPNSAATFLHFRPDPHYPAPAPTRVSRFKCSAGESGFFTKLGRLIKEKAKSDVEKIFSGFSKTRDNLAVIDELLLYWNLSDTDRVLDELEEALLVADFGPRITIKIVESLRDDIYAGKLKSGSEIKVLLAAGDAFRAAASDQLEIWAERTGCEIVVAEKENAKASSGLHTNYSLMEELVACKKAVGKVVSGAPNVVGVTGLILTKLDGSARGGCVVSVVDELGIPVKFVGVGEGVEDLQPFDAEAFVNAIFP